MHGTVPADLDTQDLARRLSELAGDERNVLVDFLLHLAEFDARRAYLDAGFPSLWTYCLSVLHLREGAAGRRIAAMKVLRQFPRLEAPLRDGRLSASTVTILAPLLTEENLDDLVARAAFKTKADVDLLVVSLRPRPAPQDGIRKLPQRTEAPSAAADTQPLALANRPLSPTGGPFDCGPASPAPRSACADGQGEGAEPRQTAAFTLSPPPRPTPEIRPVSADQWSLRVTLDGAAKADLEALKNLLGHKVPNGDLAAVLAEAIRCGIEKHGKRRGAVRPDRTRTPAPLRSDDPRFIPAEIRRQVWERDGGQCTFVGEDGRRCESRFQLELDHVTPVALGGKPTADGLALRCRPHNIRLAERVFGERHMARFRRGNTRTGENAIASDSALSVKPGADAT